MELQSRWLLLRSLLASNKWTYVAYSLFLLTIYLVPPASAISIEEDRRYDYESGWGKDLYPEDTRTEEQKNQDLIKNFINSLDSRGKWLNSPLPEQTDVDAVAVEQDIQRILTEYKEKNPKLREVPIRIFVYENSVPNAWVARFSPKSESKNGVSIRLLS